MFKILNDKYLQWVTFKLRIRNASKYILALFIVLDQCKIR